MAQYYMQYPPLPNATTQAFIDDSGITATGNLMSDFHAALVQYCVDAGAIASTAYGEKLSQDDLWNLYIKFVVSQDSNAEAGNPAGAGRGRGGHVGNNPGHYYPEPASNARGRANPNARFPTAGFSSTQEIEWFDYVNQVEQTAVIPSTNNGASHWSSDGAYWLSWSGNNFRMYAASTPWDQSTLTLDSSFLQTTAGVPNDVWLHPDGTYWSAKQSTALNVYLMSTPYDLTSSTLIDGPDAFNGEGCQWLADGTGFYRRDSSDRLSFVPINTPWDMSTFGTTDNLSLNKTANNWGFSTTTANLTITRDGLYAIIDGGELGCSGGAALYEFDEAFGLPTNATFKGVFMANDDDLGFTKQTVDYSLPKGRIYFHSYGNPWYVTSFGFPTQSGDPSTISTTADTSFSNFAASHYSSCWSAKGDYFYYHNGTLNRIEYRQAATPWDASTLGAVLGTLAEAGSTSIGCAINAEGDKFWIKQSASVAETTLSTPYDISTGGAYTTYAVGGGGAFTLAKHGMRYWVAGTTTINEYDLSTRHSISTSSASVASLDTSSDVSANICGIQISSEGKYLYVMCEDGTMAWYTLPTRGSIASAEYGGTLDFSGTVGTGLSYCGFDADNYGNNQYISITNFLGNDVFNFTHSA